VALKPFIERGIHRVIGFEPAKNLAEQANREGVHTENMYFNTETINGGYEKTADLILASNVFAHADDLKSMAKAALHCLKDDGTLIIEVQYVLDTIKDLTFDNIYHEHFNYWSVTTLAKFFEQLGATLVDVDHVDTHGGSIRVYVQKGERLPMSSYFHYIDEEKEFGLGDIETFHEFARCIEKVKYVTNKNIKKMKENGNTIVGYAAPAKATTTLNYFGISDEIEYIKEDNPLKHDKFVPGVKIPIRGDFNGKDPDKVIVFAWNFINEIKEANRDMDAEFISIKELST
jgi:hypothetical protein